MNARYIYALRDPRDQAIYYIGRTKDYIQRFLRHKYLQEEATKGWVEELKALDLLPSLEILSSVPDEQYTPSLERELILEYKPALNLALAGKTCYTLSDETRAKMSLAKRGKRYRLGKTFTPEQRARIAESNRKTWEAKRRAKA